VPKGIEKWGWGFRVGEKKKSSRKAGGTGPKRNFDGKGGKLGGEETKHREEKKSGLVGRGIRPNKKFSTPRHGSVRELEKGTRDRALQQDDGGSIFVKKRQEEKGVETSLRGGDHIETSQTGQKKGGPGNARFEKGVQKKLKKRKKGKWWKQPGKEKNSRK